LTRDCHVTLSAALTSGIWWGPHTSVERRHVYVNGDCHESAAPSRLSSRLPPVVMHGRSSANLCARVRPVCLFFPPSPLTHLQKATAPGLLSFATFLVVQFWLSLAVAGWYGGEYAWGWWKVRSEVRKRQQAERAALAAAEMPTPAPGSPGSDGDGEVAAVDGEGEAGEGDAVRRRGKSKARVSASEVDEEDE
jgi:hypothetical protein